MDPGHPSLTGENKERSDSNNESGLPSSSMRTMFSRFTGAGADAGRAAKNLGNLILNSVDAIASWKRVRAISSTCKEDGTVGPLTDEDVNDLFEFQRLGLYPSGVQKRATIFSLRAAAASQDYFDQVLRSLLRRPKWDIKNFLLFRLPRVERPSLFLVHARLTAQALSVLLDSKLEGTEDTFDPNDFASLVGGIAYLPPPEELAHENLERWTDKCMDNLFNLRRSGLCPSHVQIWATELILRAADVSQDRFDQVLRSLLRLPKCEVKDFTLFQLWGASLVNRPTLFLVHVNLTSQALSALLNPKPGTTGDLFNLDDFAPALGIARPTPRPDPHDPKEFRSLLFKRAQQAANNERNFSIALALAQSGWASMKKQKLASDGIWRDEWTDELRYVISSLVSPQVVDGRLGDVIERFFRDVGSILFHLHYHADSCEDLPEPFWSIVLEIVQIIDGSNPNLDSRAVETLRAALDDWDHLILACSMWRLSVTGRVRMSSALVRWSIHSLQNYNSRMICCIRNAIRTDGELDNMAMGDQELRTQMGEAKAALRRKLGQSLR